MVYEIKPINKGTLQSHQSSVASKPIVAFLAFYCTHVFPAGLFAIYRCSFVAREYAVTDAMAQIIPFHCGVNLVHEEYLHKKDRAYGGKQHWHA